MAALSGLPSIQTVINIMKQATMCMMKTEIL